MAEYEFATSEFAELAARLDALQNDLTPSERAILFAVFRMAGDYLDKHTAPRPGAARVAEDTSQLETTSAQQGGSVGSRLEALEMRVRQLEARVGMTTTAGNLEGLAVPPLAIGAVQLRTEGGGLPKLSDGFIGSFRGGRAARVMAADDVGVSVNVGVMF